MRSQSILSSMTKTCRNLLCIVLKSWNLTGGLSIQELNHILVMQARAIHIDNPIYVVYRRTSA